MVTASIMRPIVSHLSQSHPVILVIHSMLGPTLTLIYDFLTLHDGLSFHDVMFLPSRITFLDRINVPNDIVNLADQKCTQVRFRT